MNPHANNNDSVRAARNERRAEVIKEWGCGLLIAAVVYILFIWAFIEDAERAAWSTL